MRCHRYRPRHAGGMKHAIAIVLALLASPAAAQQFPTIPAQTVVGRIGTVGDTGPAQAITFDTLKSTLGGTQAANVVQAGPATGVATFPTYRALVNADLTGITSLPNVTSVRGVTITAGTGTLTLGANTLTVNGATGLTPGVAGQVGIWTAGVLSGSATPTLGAAGTLGSLTFGNATSGLVTLQPVTGALGTVTATLPANTGTIAETNYAQTWSANQTFSAQIISTFGTPTITSGACGTTTNGTVGAGSTNHSGFINIGAAATTTCDINFSTTITAPNACVISAGNAAAIAATTLAWVGAPSATAWRITGAVLANTVWRYHCL